MKRLGWPLLLSAICALAFIARCWNLADVFVAGRVYFVDADCYSRMTRAGLVAAGRGPVIRQHDFENFPHGTAPHTTAPLDWLIVAGKNVLDAGFWLLDRNGTSVLRSQTLDLSGALSSPLLGVLTCAWLGWWVRRQGGPEHPFVHTWTAPLLFAISPVLVHGTVLGRPDHQSLMILMLAVALGVEWQLWKGATRSRDAREPRLATGWHYSLAAGAAWALAMWVSLYEPLVLFAAIAGLWMIADRRRFTGREFRAGWITFTAILLVAIGVDGWRAVWPDTSTRAAFALWQTTIGELRRLDLRSPTLLHWLGAGCVLAPVLLALGVRMNGRREVAPAAMLLLLLVLTVWQLRWGYFLALAYAMSLPWQLAMLRRTWVGAVIFLLGLWPVAQHWEAALFPEGPAEKARNEKRAENVQLRAVAAAMRGERAAFLAPWWLSPALAFWSGQPGVAGSSHQALPGTMESARFFLAPDTASAEAVARRLDVRWIVTDGADADGVSRLVKAYAPLLGRAVPEAPWGVAMHERGRPRERVSADDLREATPELRAKLLALAERAEIEELGTAAFTCVFKSDYFKLFRVAPASPH